MVQAPLATDKVVTEIEGSIGWLTFNNPARRNAVSVEMWRAVPEALDRLEADTAVRVIVVRGAGDKAFVSGLDVSQFDDQDPSRSVAAREALSARANERLRNSPKPVIAMIHGYCIGSGVLIAANCDLRIAADTATLAVTAARLGLGYPVAGIDRLIELVGPAGVKEIFFTARHFSAAEAHAMGLINRVVPAADLERAVRDCCETIAGNAPLTIAAVKQTVAALAARVPQADLAACERAMRACAESADHAEGRRAFSEKRKPVFVGR